MLQILQQLRNKVAVGFVGGSDLVKQQEQLGSTETNGTFPPCVLKLTSSHRYVWLLFRGERTYSL